MAQPDPRIVSDDRTLGAPATPARARPIDASDAELADHHYREPEVNRLKEWALRANTELSEEAILNAHVRVLPVGQAIVLMTASSLVLWGIIAAAVWQLV